MEKEHSAVEREFTSWGGFSQFLLGMIVISITMGSLLGEFRPVWERFFLKEVPCRILESYILEKTDSDKGIYFYPVIRFSYSIAGKDYEHTGYANYDPVFYDYAEAQKIIDTWSSGQEGVCFVDPKDFSRAVVDLTVNPVILVFFAIVLIFLFCVIWLLLRVSIGNKVPGPGISRMESNEYNRQTGMVALRGFATIAIVLACIAQTWIISEMFARPFREAHDRKRWIPVTCQVEWRQVRESNDSDSNTQYYPNILYRYQYYGKTYKSNDYGDVKFGTYDYIRDIVMQYPPGLKTTCHVNPDNPRKAVLNSQFNLNPPEIFFNTFLASLFPWMFLLIGMGLYRFSNSMPGNLKIFFPADRDVDDESAQGALNFPKGDWPLSESKLMRMTDSRLEELPDSGEIKCVDFPENPREKKGPRVMSLPESSVGKVGCFFLLSLLWCGPIFSIFVAKIGERSYGEMLFLLPFVGVGVFLAILVIYCFLALFNPNVEVVVEKCDYLPGENLFMTWRLRGRKHGVRSLVIRFEGSEKATYSQGTSDITETSVFFNRTVFSSTDPAKIASGKVNVEIPLGMMHSFDAVKNKIEWKIKIEGEIPLWPDVAVEFPVNILPQR